MSKCKMEELLSESDGASKKDRLSWACRRSEGDQEDAPPPGGRSAGDLYGPGGTEHPEKISTDRSPWKAGQY